MKINVREKSGILFFISRNFELLNDSSEFMKIPEKVLISQIPVIFPKKSN